MHDENSFLTLTYDDQHLPSDRSVCVRDLQLFFKRLRERVAPTRVRFFACGEYGERLGRPHYHAIVFGWFPSDAVCVKRSGDLSLFTSSMLSATWGLGNASVGHVSFDSASYVANYASKQIRTNKAAEASRLAGRSREFLVMSRRPGIGRSWIEKFSSDVYPSDQVIVRGFPARPPRYYDQAVLHLCRQSTADLLARREAEAEKLEAFMLPDGSRVDLVPSRNARRLAVREKVARAKFALKIRQLEGD